jgi:hypothetical protein
VVHSSTCKRVGVYTSARAVWFSLWDLSVTGPPSTPSTHITVDSGIGPQQLPHEAHTHRPERYRLPLGPSMSRAVARYVSQWVVERWVGSNAGANLKLQPLELAYPLQVTQLEHAIGDLVLAGCGVGQQVTR